MAHVVAKLAAVDIERRPALFRHRREGQRHRRVRHVAAADIEQPGHACGSETTSASALSFLDLGADARKLGFGGLAGIAQVMQHDGAERRLRPVAPAGIDRIVVDRDQTCARRFAGLGEPLSAVDRMQPGRIAEFGARRQIFFDPLRRRMLDQMLDRKDRGIDLLAHLHRVAAIDEDRGAVG